MTAYYIHLPQDFHDYEWEYEKKGCLLLMIDISGKSYFFTFYDPVRLEQTIKDNLSEYNYFFEENLVVIDKVNLKNIQNFIENMINTEK
ncbi:hypothetical protein [Acinetobacter bereziniae]|uniref:hypothetical protein n=1 Tax=Acinetobacter bereziniae TaxID=106648 RepID=UPI00125F6ED6|nr:hypothetical protein [Acinetobacter bereziniae]